MSGREDRPPATRLRRKDRPVVAIAVDRLDRRRHTFGLLLEHLVVLLRHLFGVFSVDSFPGQRKDFLLLMPDVLQDRRQQRDPRPLPAIRAESFPRAG